MNISCAACERRGDGYKVFKGLSSIRYSDKIVVSSFHCSNGHKWDEKSCLPTPPKDDE